MLLKQQKKKIKKEAVPTGLYPVPTGLYPVPTGLYPVPTGLYFDPFSSIIQHITAEQTEAAAVLSSKLAPCRKKKQKWIEHTKNTYSSVAKKNHTS